MSCKHEWVDTYTDRTSPQSYENGSYRGFRLVGIRCKHCGTHGVQGRDRPGWDFPRCPHCNGPVTHPPSSGQWHCETCMKLVDLPLQTRTLPLWQYISRILLRNGGPAGRLILKISLSSYGAAQELRKALGCGRVEKGSVLAEGRDLAPAAAAIGIPPKIVGLLEEYTGITAAPGFPFTPEQVSVAQRVLKELDEAMREVLATP